MPHANMAHWRSLITGEPVDPNYRAPRSVAELVERRAKGSQIFEKLNVDLPDVAAAHERVPALLNASDLAFLLLRGSPNIATSSPAKFAEYLTCGVPVIITNGVGDFSSLVHHRKLGEVLKDSIVSDKLVQAVINFRSALAERCALGGRELTWQFHRDTAKYVF